MHIVVRIVSYQLTYVATYHQMPHMQKKPLPSYTSKQTGVAELLISHTDSSVLFTVNICISKVHIDYKFVAKTIILVHTVTLHYV